MTSPPTRSPAEVAAAQAALARPCRSCGHAYAAHAPDGCRTCQLLASRVGTESCPGWRPPADDDPPPLGEVEAAADTLADAMATAIGGAEDDDDTTRRVLAVLRANRAGLEVILGADDVVDAEVLDPVGDVIRGTLTARFGDLLDPDYIAAAAAEVVAALEEHADDVAAYLGLHRPAGGELNGERLAALARAIATATNRYNGEGTNVLAALARDGWRLERTGRPGRVTP